MRGHVRKRRTWEFIVDIRLHLIAGRRRQKSMGGFATRKEAQSTLHEFDRRRRRSRLLSESPWSSI